MQQDKNQYVTDIDQIEAALHYVAGDARQSCDLCLVYLIGIAQMHIAEKTKADRCIDNERRKEENL